MAKILIIAGEASGDKHGAGLIKELKVLIPNLNIYGIGGDAMKSAGMELLEHNRNMAFLGFVEVIRHLGYIKKKLKQVHQFLVDKKPDLVILIDYPGFNLKIASYAKILGIPVVYYICPQIWAWGQNRVKKIKKWINLPLVILPFEEEFYQKHGIMAKYVGHPSLETVIPQYSGHDFTDKFELDKNKRLIGLLPGSRKMEVQSLLPEMLLTVKKLSVQFGDLQFVVGKTETLDNKIYREIIERLNANVILIDNCPYDIMKYSDMVMVASGTASLETAISGTPAVVLYKVSPITYWLGKKLIKVPFISLTNLILKKEVFPEFIQSKCTADNIFDRIRTWLTEPAEYDHVLKEIDIIQSILGHSSASKNAALEIKTLLSE